MRGLQAAVAEGWLIQRARDMCSFAHDRHYQTAMAMAEAMPEGAVASMSLRVYCDSSLSTFSKRSPDRDRPVER